MARVRGMVVLVAALCVAAPAMAQSDAIRGAHDAITRGDMAAAEQLLTTEQRVFPGSPEVLVNLAAVYAATGRPVQAGALYRRVLARDDVLLDQSKDRTVSSHRIAEVGLQRLANVQTAAR